MRMNFYINEELCAHFVDWQRAYDHVNWTKSIQILKGTGIDWHERRVNSRLQESMFN
jgi:hypothetical protein